MKKIFTISCLLLVITFTVQQARAQVDGYYIEFDFGIRGGVNFATLNDVEANANVDLGTSTGLLAGVYFQFPIKNSPIVIQPEILYSQKGYELEGDDGTTVTNLNYIEVPVLVKFNYVLDGPLTPYVAAGPYVGFPISSSIELNGETVVEDIDNIQTIDFGVVVGAGLNYQRFNLGVRYSAGLVPVFDEDDASAKNGVFSIVAGVSF